MAASATEIIDGIKKSVEAVGRSSHDSVRLDNVSFRLNCRKLDVPHDSAVAAARSDAARLLENFDLESYDPESGAIYLSQDRADAIACLQTLPAEHRVDGRYVDLTATIPCVDVANELPQVVLNCEMFLHGLADATYLLPGRITFNIALAYVLWDDIEQLVEWDEIEIPR